MVVVLGLLIVIVVLTVSAVVVLFALASEAEVLEGLPSLTRGGSFGRVSGAAPQAFPPRPARESR